MEFGDNGKICHKKSSSDDIYIVRHHDNVFCPH